MSLRMPWHNLHTELYDDLFSHSSTIKAITGTSAVREAAVLVLLKRWIFKYFLEMASGGIMYILIFITISSEIQVILKLIPQQCAML